MQSTDNTLISVRSLSSPFSAYPDKANLSYAESYSIVTLFDQPIGSDKMLQLLNTFKQGTLMMVLCKLFMDLIWMD